MAAPQQSLYDVAFFTRLHHRVASPRPETPVFLTLVHATETSLVCDQSLAMSAARSAQPRLLEFLCAAGMPLRMTNDDDDSPLDVALDGLPRTAECVRVLLANGVRLRSARPLFCNRVRITPDLLSFERGVLRCRVATVAMLRVKRASGVGLVRWDRFLLAKLAVCVWATRYARPWAM